MKKGEESGRTLKKNGKMWRTKLEKGKEEDKIKINIDKTIKKCKES